MRKTGIALIVVLGIILVLSFNIWALKRTPVKVSRGGPQASTVQDTLFYHDFENGMTGFTTDDETDDEAYWHLDSYNAYEGSGYSWWCGANPGEGWATAPGYGNGWTQFLFSPVWDFSGAPSSIVLSFYHKYDCEPSSGSPWFPEDWDGGCVFISIDGGSTFMPITPTANSDQEYTASNLWGFEYNGYGPDIPGWNGDSEGWIYAEFDLSEYAGENQVQLRFGFASDGVLSDEDGYEGGDFDGAWYIDNVKIKVGPTEQYFQDFNDGQSHNWTAEAAPPVGDYWIMTDNRYASPDTAMYCGNSQTWSLPQGLNNCLVSPMIDLTNMSEAFLDFRFWMGIPPQGETLLDGVIVEIYGNNKYWENIAGTAQGFSDDSQMWIRYCESGSPCELTPWLGQEVRIRIWIESDYEDQEPLGEGIYLDDFLIIGEEETKVQKSSFGKVKAQFAPVKAEKETVMK
jgi:hypothetical protein